MDAYKVKTTVKNGQIILDLPSEFNDTAVEVIVLQVTEKPYIDASDELHLAEETVLPYGSSKKIEQTEEQSEQLAKSKPDESGFIQPRKKIDLRTLRGKISNESAEKMYHDIEEAYESDFWYPFQSTDITKLRGALKLDMTNDEIDSLTKSWRNEWNRDIS